VVAKSEDGGPTVDPIEELCFANGGPTQAFSVALSVFGGRVNAERGGRFAVILRGDGPPIDLPELPAKHV